MTESLLPVPVLSLCGAGRALLSLCGFCCPCAVPGRALRALFSRTSQRAFHARRRELPAPEPWFLSFSASYCPLVALVEMPSWLALGLPFSPPFLQFLEFFFHSLPSVCSTASLSSLRLVMLKQNCLVTELF